MSEQALPSDPPPADPPPADPPPSDPPPSDPPPADPPAPKAWLSELPDDWRNQLAGDDEGKLNQLNRVASFDKLVDNYFEAQRKIRAGEIEAAQVPDEHSSEEEWAAFREQQGIPESADGYDLSLDEGLVLGDEDKAVLDQVYPVAHELNLSGDQVNKLANAMIKAQSEQWHGEEIRQEGYKTEAISLLKEAWKGDFDTNMKVINDTLVQALPEAVRENFEHATLADGRKLFNSPEVMIAMADWARMINPAGTVVPNNANPAQAIDTEIASLRARMGDDDWHSDSAAQRRYQELITAKERMAAQS